MAALSDRLHRRHRPLLLRSPGTTPATTARAPIDASSGTHIRHRLNPNRNRQAQPRPLRSRRSTQISHNTAGRGFYLRRQAQGHSRKEALRALKRRTLRRRLQRTPRRRSTLNNMGPGEHPGTTLQCSVARQSPDVPALPTSYPRTRHNVTRPPSRPQSRVPSTSPLTQTGIGRGAARKPQARTDHPICDCPKTPDRAILDTRRRATPLSGDGSQDRVDGVASSRPVRACGSPNRVRRPFETALPQGSPVNEGRHGCQRRAAWPTSRPSRPRQRWSGSMPPRAVVRGT